VTSAPARRAKATVRRIAGTRAAASAPARQSRLAAEAARGSAPSAAAHAGGSAPRATDTASAAPKAATRAAYAYEAAAGPTTTTSVRRPPSLSASRSGNDVARSTIDESVPTHTPAATAASPSEPDCMYDVPMTMSAPFAATRASARPLSTTRVE